MTTRVPATHMALARYLSRKGDAISLQQKQENTTLAKTSKYVHPAVINERVSPMDKVKIKPLNRPYRKAQR